VTCRHCGKVYPSEYYFKPGRLCSECWEHMTPEDRQRYAQASGLHRMTTTAFELPGHTVVECFGVVRGIIVRSRSLFGTIGGALQTVVGGNITLFSELCERTRSDAFEMMLQHASELGANAVVGVRYDATEIMDGVSEVLCYGTAVVVRPGTSTAGVR
jgi:uncharacterized protein YbjQ (UPF0145 family)